MSPKYRLADGTPVPEGYRVISGPHRTRDIFARAEDLLVVWDDNGRADLVTDLVIARGLVSGVFRRSDGARKRVSITNMNSGSGLICTLYELGLDSTKRHKREQSMLDQLGEDIAAIHSEALKPRDPYAHCCTYRGALAECHDFGCPVHGSKPE